MLRKLWKLIRTFGATKFTRNKFISGLAITLIRVDSASHGYEGMGATSCSSVSPIVFPFVLRDDSHHFLLFYLAFHTSLRVLRRFQHSVAGFHLLPAKHISFLVDFGVIVVIYADGVCGKNRLVRVFGIACKFPEIVLISFVLWL
jgi:hypothetical protein